MSVVVLTVPDISCARCEEAMAAAVAPLPGVESVAVDVSAKTVTVRAGEGFDEQTVRAAIGDAGYDVAAVTKQEEGL